MDDYVSKPFKQDDLRTVIDRIEAGMRRHDMEPPGSKGIDFDQ